MSGSMIKRGVFAAAALSMATVGMAQAADVTVQYVMNMNTPYRGMTTGGVTNGSLIAFNQNGYNTYSNPWVLDPVTQTAVQIFAAPNSHSGVSGFSGDQIVGAMDRTSPVIYPKSTYFHQGQMRAGMWTGPEHTWVNLHPDGDNSTSQTVATATDGIHQVGAYAATQSGASKAVMWSGTADSMVYLTPQDSSISSGAHAIDGDVQGGWLSDSSVKHAALWHGPGNPVADLNPSGAYQSQVNVMAGGKQFGYAYGKITDYTDHAMMWSGTAESAVDLHPSEYYSSYVYNASQDGIQVGVTMEVLPVFRLESRAAAWLGSAESYIDLSSYLPSSAGSSSAHCSIGNTIYGYAYMYNSADWSQPTGAYLVAWTIPEPGALGLLGLAGLGLLKRRR